MATSKTEPAVDVRELADKALAKSHSRQREELASWQAAWARRQGAGLTSSGKSGQS